MSLNTSDWWRLIRDFKNWFLHKSVQLGVSITDQIWLLSRALPCFRSDSLWIKKGDLAVLIIIIAFCCFLLSSFCSRSFLPPGKPLFFTSFPPKSWLQLQADFRWFLESAMTLAFSSVNGGPNKSLLNDTQNFLYSVSKASHHDFPLETVASWTQAQFLLRNARFISSDLRLSRGPRNAGLQFERLGV